MSKKLSDSDVAKIRDLAAQGRSPSEISDGFSVSRRHVSRIIRGETRQLLGGLDRDTATSSTVRAVDRFLDGLELRPADAVHAEAARALAAKLDAARDSNAATAAQAAPALARELLEVIATLRGRFREPDAVERLRQQREARLLAHLSQN
jgi:hypothetical protein